MSLPPPPSREKDITGPAWQKWFSLLKETVSPIATGGATLWSSISKAGSRLTDIERRDHADLQNLNSETVSHLTGAQLADLTGGESTNVHKHDHSLQLNLNSANYTHLTAVNATDLTDGGATTLHKHDHGGMDGLGDDDHTQYVLVTNLEADRATVVTNWDDLTDAGVTALHQHDFDHVTYPAAKTIGAPDHQTLQEILNHVWSSGVTHDCTLVNNLDGTISIGAGTAAIRAIADGHSTIYNVGLSAQLNIVLTDNATNYVYLDYTSGTPQFAVSTSLTSFNCMDKCIAYMVHRAGNLLHYVDAREQNVDSNRKVRQFLLRQRRFWHDDNGTVFGANGLALTVTAGSFNFMLQSVPHTAFDTSIAGTANANVFTLWTLAGSTWTETADSKVISTLLYNNIATGTVALGNNKFGVSWVYLVNDTPGELHVVMGQAEYANLADATVASPPTTIPTLISGLGSLVGFVAYEKNNTVFNGVYSSFSTSFTPSLATVHNGLSGLQGGTLNEYYHLTAAQQALIPSGTPSVGQVPTATSATTSTWQTPSVGGASAVSNVISVPTTIAADTTYIVASYLKSNSDLTINGNLLIVG